MNGRRSRVARKAARVNVTELDRQFNSGIASLKQDRDKALAEANTAFETGLTTLKNDRAAARKTADDAYEEGRTKLLKWLGSKDAKKAAA